LARRAREGGSYHVRVSLCQSGMYIYRQGKTDYPEPDMNLSPTEVEALQMRSETAAGPIRHLRPVLELSETSPHWSRPTPVRGGARPEWLSQAHRRGKPLQEKISPYIFSCKGDSDPVES